jgi:hypothetical protein
MQEVTAMSIDPKTRENIIEMQRIVPLAEAARLRGVSIDTLRRTQRHNFVRVSPGRLGMRIFDALYALDFGAPEKDESK